MSISLKLPNIQKDKTKQGTLYRYRIRLKGQPVQYFYLGNDNIDTSQEIRQAYKDARKQASLLKLGIQPVTQVSNPGKPEVKQVLLKDVFPIYKDAKQHINKTFLTKIHNWKHFIEFFGKESDWLGDSVSNSCSIDLLKIDANGINAFYSNEYKKGIKASTVADRHKILNPFYTWLHDNEYIKKNYYLKKVELLKASSGKTPYQVLERHQAEKIVDNAPNDYCRYLWSIMLDTAMAPVDANKLDKAKDYKDGIIVTTRQKSGEYTGITMSKRLLSLGDAIYNLNGSKKARDNANKSFQETCKKLGIQKQEGRKLTQYCLRHSLATYLAECGLTKEQIQRSLGHCNDETQKIYIRNQIKSEQQSVASVLNKRK